jgi:hypothetical protein
MAAICTESSERVQRMTVDPVALRAAAVSYGRRTLRAFGIHAANWDLGPNSAIPVDLKEDLPLGAATH